MKRKGGTLTGGIGDVKPQLLTISNAASSADAVFTTTQFGVPVPRIGPKQDRAIIMEILKIYFYDDSINDIGDNANRTFLGLSTVSLAATGDTFAQASAQSFIADPRCIAAVESAHAITTSGGWNVTLPIVVDLTDASGNGVLVATDSIFLTSAQLGATTLGVTVAKILYRQYEAGMLEYVGIVQSQQ